MKLKNFRQYGDASFTFKLNPPANDAHLVIGGNGVGKSNLLNAIEWCLYGEETHLRDSETALPLVNTSYAASLCASGKKGGEGIKEGEISVSVTLTACEDGVDKLEAIRTARFTVNNNNKVNVFKNELAVRTWRGRETEQPLKGNDAQMCIQRNIPREIRSYIFFDGEQLEDYFSEAQRKRISDEIKKFSQIKILDDAIGALDDYIKKDLEPEISDRGDERTQKCQAKVGEIKDALNECISQKKQYEEQKEKAQGEIDALSSRIYGYEFLPGKKSSLESLEKELDSLRAELQGRKGEYIKYVRGIYPYFALYPALKAYHDHIAAELDSVV